MQFSEEIIEIFDYIGEKFGIAIDWSSENVMPYLQELCGRYINWEIATSVVWMVIGFALLLLLIPIIKKYKQDKKMYEDGKMSRYDYIDVPFLTWFMSITVVLIASTFILTQTFDIIRCICLPELEIYEYITRLMRNQ